MMQRLRLDKRPEAVGTQSHARPASAAAFVVLTEKDQNKVELTTAQLAYMFDVTNMTLYNWRAKKGMPFYHLEGGAKPPVRYDEGLILQWANQNGIAIKHFDYKSVR